MPFSHLSLKRPRLLLVLATTMVLAAVGVMQVLHLWVARGRAIQTAERRASNMASVLAEYVRGSFAATDTSLRQLAAHSGRLGGPAAAPGDWNPVLAAAKASVPGAGSFSVTDAQGTILHSTLRSIVGESRRDNYAFRVLASSGRDELVVDRPFPSRREPPEFIIPIGRRLSGRDGRFQGTVVATMLPERYRAFFRTIDVGASGSIWMFHPDGVILVREPSTGNPINMPAESNPLLTAARSRQPAGVLAAPIREGGPRFISAYHTIAGPQLVIAVSLNQDDVLTGWRQEVRSSALAVLALMLTLTVIAGVAFRQAAARARAERELNELQRLEAERLRETNDRLEQALEREQKARHESEAASYLKDEFLMTVSHELRTPLTAIHGWTRMLATNAMPDSERPRALAAVERNARAQTRLIDDLLDVSRAISGKLRIDAHPINLTEVLHAAVETLKPAMEARRIRFSSSVEPGIGPIVADPDRVQQIVWNVLSNAIKFTPEEGSVRLRVTRADESVAIAITDTGCGIAPEFLPFVFDRFRQAEAGTRRRFGGLGLGLAIARHLVELHGGTISVDSAGEGRGSTFTVVLPVRAARADSPTRPPIATPAPAPRPAARLDGLKLLVVDDDADARELFASILSGAGAKVRTAASVPEALTVLGADSIDMVLSDIEMPTHDGYELLRRARQALNASDLLAVAVTAHARAVDRRRALDAGFDAHIAKPIDPAVLVSELASLAHGRGAPTSNS